MTKNYYIVGLPSSGKTTFLAALCYVLSYTQDRKFRLSSCSDRAYITKIVDRWLAFQTMAHTPLDTHEEVRMSIADQNQELFELILPDTAGEFFKKAARSMEQEKRFREAIRSCSRILFFINPAVMSPETAISDVAEKYRNMHSEDDQADAALKESSEDEEPSKANGGKDGSPLQEKSGEDGSPLQDNSGEDGSLLQVNKTDEPTVELKETEFSMGEHAENVELLQSILENRKELVSISVVISAWDVFADEKKKPEEILRNHVPLLWQVLESHRERLRIGYWGLSAQGGSLDSGNDEVEQLKEKSPEERMMVVDADGMLTDDITRILE